MDGALQSLSPILFCARTRNWYGVAAMTSFTRRERNCGAMEIPSGGVHSSRRPMRCCRWKALTSRLKLGGDTQVTSAVVSVTEMTRGGAGGSGWRGVVYQDLSVQSCEEDTITEQSGVIAKL